MIFAKVDVKLRDHIKAQRAGVAMSTWTWALLYAREQETDGLVPTEALRGSWVGEATALKHASKLVEVGLWEEVPGGWQIVRYGDKNETRKAIEERRRGDRERKRRTKNEGSEPPNPPSLPSSVSLDSGRNPSVNPAGAPGDSVAGIPGSGSGSVSESREGVQGETPPEWFVAAAESAAMSIGGTIDELPARWVSYRASRGRKGWAKNHEDAVGWLSDVVRRERREQRDRSAPKSESRLVAVSTKRPSARNLDDPEELRKAGYRS